MKKFSIIFLFLILNACSLNKVVHHHGVHNLEKKQTKLIIDKSNRNDILGLIGPPSVKSTFDNDIFIYIERKKSASKLSKLGKRKLLRNNVLVLQIDLRGILVNKQFFNMNDMTEINFDKKITATNYQERSFIYNFLSSLRQKIDDPLGKKRIGSN
tara:strand:- start:91 stop:558 length:468 start_codon:yes stop_codon:yes gene_type:complete